MYEGQFVFSQIMTHLPWKTFHRCVDRYRGDHKVRTFRCSQQYRSMALAQMCRRSSLRELVVCLRCHSDKLYHLGLSAGISRSTLAKANENRDWRIYADFAQRLIAMARPLYGPEDSELNLRETVYALDSSTIDLCLSLFPWAPFRKTKSGIKLHTLLDLQGNIPSFIEITDAKLNDVNILDAFFARTRFHLCDGSCIRRLPAAAYISQLWQLLRRARQIQYQVPSPLLACQ